MKVLHIRSIGLNNQACAMLYPNSCYKRPCYNEVAVYLWTVHHILWNVLEGDIFESDFSLDYFQQFSVGNVDNLEVK